MPASGLVAKSPEARLARSDNPTAAPFRAPYLVVDDFLPIDMANALRLQVDAHFSAPDSHAPATHQVWNYWYVAGQYTYLRTRPEKIIARPLVDRFVHVLGQWSSDTLGMGQVTWPNLSLYVAGCRQGMHNDAGNGRFGFVYSLTRDRRQTSGGDTIVLNEGDLFRDNLRRPAAGSSFHASIEPRFNRLVVFDDRLPHAVEHVEGSMDPVEGRLVLHGHLRDSGAIVVGALSAETIAEVIVDSVLEFTSDAMARLQLYHGPLVLRFAVDSSGRVESCRILIDRVISPDAGDVGWAPLVASLVTKVKALRFPPAEAATMVTQPILLGGPLPVTDR